ncbi:MULTISPECIES: type II toxin-antitoxin system RelE/ParE family toxin [Pseudomonas]|uniref:Type II toxin-antitoxin system RelE/ParE family toxin n=1 Tax=Pseudomonas paracarnis TaxID=2750625 RepID=A0ABU6BRE9_9PSED|nr:MULTISPECIES: type II toxin-antitoxin system RelE/ParE family toxin [Pseudomonas]MDG9889223.1 type II toxin-antitoxin system RelE/ParE family toxin [Pseudomonas juntendi]MEB3782410.1 type II toxin-antitoxin system RelE/ParE family toxin [Pseudomonas paracarnis]
MINTLHTTPEFDGWLISVTDPIGKAAILTRIQRAENGNFGDVKPVGDAVSEMRVFEGPGYRVYYVKVGLTAYLLLWGSDKKDQKRGIKRAKEILDALRGKKR